MPPRIVLEGQKFNKLTVLSFSHMTKKSQSYWNCICDCGKEKIIRGGCIVSGHTKSCGCFKLERSTKHGLRSLSIYQIWKSMKQRCYNPKDANYKHYGGRGIKVSKRWFVVENFYKDMGDRPKNKSLDRINNNGNYTYKNCRWATHIEQHNNTRSNRRITVKGKTHTIAEWGRFSKINNFTIYARLRMGWSPEKAISIKVQKYTIHRERCSK